MFIGPLRRVGLDQADHLRNCHLGPDANQQVSVVFDAADFEQLAVVVADDAANNLVEFLTQIVVNRAPPEFRAEDDVVRQIRERAGHCAPSDAAPAGASHR